MADGNPREISGTEDISMIDSEVKNLIASIGEAISTLEEKEETKYILELLRSGRRESLDAHRQLFILREACAFILSSLQQGRGIIEIVSSPWEIDGTLAIKAMVRHRLNPFFDCNPL